MNTRGSRHCDLFADRVSFNQLRQSLRPAREATDGAGRRCNDASALAARLTMTPVIARA